MTGGKEGLKHIPAAAEIWETVNKHFVLSALTVSNSFVLERGSHALPLQFQLPGWVGGAEGAEAVCCLRTCAAWRSLFGEDPWIQIETITSFTSCSVSSLAGDLGMVFWHMADAFHWSCFNFSWSIWWQINCSSTECPHVWFYWDRTMLFPGCFSFWQRVQECGSTALVCDSFTGHLEQSRACSECSPSFLKWKWPFTLGKNIKFTSSWTDEQKREK